MFLHPKSQTTFRGPTMFIDHPTKEPSNQCFYSIRTSTESKTKKTHPSHLRWDTTTRPCANRWILNNVRSRFNYRLLWWRWSPTFSLAPGLHFPEIKRCAVVHPLSSSPWNKCMRASYKVSVLCICNNQIIYHFITDFSFFFSFLHSSSILRFFLPSSASLENMQNCTRVINECICTQPTDEHAWSDCGTQCTLGTFGPPLCLKKKIEKCCPRDACALRNVWTS